MSFQIIADLQKVPAKDGYVVHIPDGEFLGDGFGGDFQWQDTPDTVDDDSPTIGANSIKPVNYTGNGRYVRVVPKEITDLQADVNALKNIPISQDVDIKIEDALYPYNTKPSILTPLTAAGTIPRANALQPLGTISTNQTATMPNVSQNAGQYCYIYVTNTGAGVWTANSQQLRDGHFYAFFSDGTTWIDATNNNQAFQYITTGSPVTLIVGMNIIDRTDNFTVVMPASPKNGDPVKVSFLQTTGTITWPGDVLSPMGGSIKTSREYIRVKSISKWA